MKKLELFVLMIVIASLSSCQVIGDIFKAGMGVGIFLVLAVIGLIIFVVAKVGGK